MGRIGDLVSKYRKPLIGLGIVGSLNTLAMHKDGVWPIYTDLHGKSAGILVAGAVGIADDAEHYGLIIAPLIAYEGKGTLKGGGLSLVNSVPSGKLYGLELSVFGNLNRMREDSSGNSNTTPTRHIVNGVQLSAFWNTAYEVNGFQGAIFGNWNARGKNAQIGVYNNQSPRDDLNARSLGFGLHFRDWASEKKSAANKLESGRIDEPF